MPSLLRLVAAAAGAALGEAQSMGYRMCDADRAAITNVNMCNPGFTFEGFAPECLSAPNVPTVQTPTGKKGQSCGHGPGHESDCEYEGCVGEGYLRAGCGGDNICFHDIVDENCRGVPWGQQPPNAALDRIPGAGCFSDNDAGDNPGRRAYCPPRSCVAERACAQSMGVDVLATLVPPTCNPPYFFERADGRDGRPQDNACGSYGGCVDRPAPAGFRRTDAQPTRECSNGLSPHLSTSSWI